MHVFTVDGNGHLWDAFTSDALTGNSFTRTDISSQAGGNAWQVFPLSSFSSSTAVLDRAPAPIQFGSTVHVYVTDTNRHLHDFYKPFTANWSDIDLTNQMGGNALVFPGGPAAPFAYGGNSIQIATDSGSLMTFVQGVNPDGTLNANPTAVFNITQLAALPQGPVFISGTPRPVVTGDNTVNNFVDDFGGRLVDFTKTPTTNWQVSVIASLGQAGLTPAPIWDPSVGLHVVVHDSAGLLTDYFTSSTAPPLSSRGPDCCERARQRRLQHRGPGSAWYRAGCRRPCQLLLKEPGGG